MKDTKRERERERERENLHTGDKEADTEASVLLGGTI
jgi:hypothetical protein